MGLPGAQRCNMKNLHDTMQEMLEIQCSSAQDLANTTSVVYQMSQDGNEMKQNQNPRAMPCLLGLAFLCSSIATQNLFKFRPTLLVSFVYPRTSWHGRMMSLVEMTRSAI